MSKEKKPLPRPPKEYTGEDIRKLRLKSGFTQNEFAQILNASHNTVRSWENKQRIPNGIANRLLELIAKGIFTP